MAKLGDIIVFTPPAELGGDKRAGIVTEVHEDETVDITVFNGYVQGTTDYRNVAPADAEVESDQPQPRTFVEAASQ